MSLAGACQNDIFQTKVSGLSFLKMNSGSGILDILYFACRYVPKYSLKQTVFLPFICLIQLIIKLTFLHVDIFAHFHLSEHSSMNCLSRSQPEDIVIKKRQFPFKNAASPTLCANLIIHLMMDFLPSLHTVLKQFCEM